MVIESTNPYVYVANNPINAIDPDGRDIVFIIGGSRYKYDGKNLYNGKGVMVNTKNLNGTHAGKIFNAYNAVGKLSNHFNKQIQTLVDSKNEHIIDTGQLSNSGGGVIGGDVFGGGGKEISEGVSVGSITKFNFEESAKKTFKDQNGIDNSDMTTVAHELQHQIDYETGNMKDSYRQEASARKPSEIRAINNENKARKILNMDKRTKYRGENIDPKKLD